MTTAKPVKTTIAVSLDTRVVQGIRAEAARQRRPVSWVVNEYIAAALKVASASRKAVA